MEKTKIAKIAFNMIQVIRIYNNESDIENYDNLDYERKSQVMKTVDAVVENPYITAQDMHKEWADAKLFDGWRYGPETIRKEKLHNCLVPFEMLGTLQKLKDDLFIKIVKELIDA